MKAFLKRILPKPVLTIFRSVYRLPSKIYESYLIKTQPYLHRKALRKLRKKKDGPVNVVFFAIFKSVWKYDRLYWLMEKDPRFHPVVLVCPRVNFGREEMLKTLRECYADFKDRGYRVICSYDEQTDTYVDARSLNPDIIFYTNPYKGLIDDRYYITRFRDVLTCYVNYGFCITEYKWDFALPFHKLLWKYFCESEKIREIIVKEVGENRRKYVFTGYPPHDDFLLGTSAGHDWKLPDSNLKRIIWAPHHTIEEDVDLSKTIRMSNFLRLAGFMQKMAQKYAQEVQFVFKPHPLLQSKLYNHPAWGMEKTDAYYEFWKSGNNTNYVSGDYTDLFNSSDAMIHDSASFMLEYLYTLRPVLYTTGENLTSQQQRNAVAKEAYDCHYIAETEDDIDQFIASIVIGGKDHMLDMRKRFFQSTLTPPNNKTVAENIMDNIVLELF